MQRRHLTGVERASKFGHLSFFVRAGNFPALDSSTQLLLERGEDSIAPFRVLAVLLVIVQPKRRVNADEYQEQFRYPATET
jgi:hypothetical protein